jgi:hypothetical protein
VRAIFDCAEPPDDPGNPTVNFHGERRSNATHQSTTDPSDPDSNGLDRRPTLSNSSEPTPTPKIAAMIREWVNPSGRAVDRSSSFTVVVFRLTALGTIVRLSKCFPPAIRWA